MRVGAFFFGALVAVIVALFLFALSTDSPEKLNPNAICREHHGVQHVYASSGGVVQGVVCKDGHWERRH